MPTYNGNNGSNTINGSNGDDTINGNGGNDDLNGNGGNDTVNGGAGNDDISGGSGNDTLNGDDGNDEISGGTGNDTINGGSGNDELSGDENDDTINGGTGNDDISGGSGNDNLNGNDGDDDMSGGTGNDTMNGGAGNDDMNGDDNDDTMNGGTGNDDISGGKGNDTIYGDADNDTLSGDDGNDFVYGQAGYDILFGGAGNDTLDGGDQNDELSGGTGNDVLNGGNGDDQVSGDDNDDTVSGGAGNDALFGGSGNDTLTGGGGLDLIDGGSGTDTAVYSGSVFDYTIYQLGPLTGVIHNGPGGPGSGADGADLLVWVERLQFSDYTIDLVGNDAPIAIDDAVALSEDAGSYSSGAASVLDNDLDFDGDTLTVTPGVFAGTYGTLTLNANGTYTYVLNANAQTLAQGQVAQDTFVYTVSDGSASDTGILVFNIGGLNDAPVANPDTATTSENAAMTIDVLANDTDVDSGAVLTVTTASAPAGQGTASVVGNQVQFTPGSDFDDLAVGQNEVVVVSYAVQDQFGATSSSTVSITVTGTNDGPVANPDTGATSENATLLVDVLANDTDADNGAVLTVTAASAPAGQGSVSVVGNQVQFDPGSDFDDLAVGDSEVVVVSYSISDEHGATSSSTVTITVTGTNDGPVANPDTDTTSENAILLVDVLGNDTDTDDGAVLTVTAASAPAGQGTASVVGNQVQFDPGSDFDDLAVGDSEVVVISYSIEDEHGAASSSTLTVTVTGTNDGPVANPDTGGTSENATILVDVLANDTDVDDGAVLTVTAASAPAGQGTASVVGNQVGFDPGSDFDYLADGESTAVVVSYSIEDEHGATSSSTVTITVTGTNDAPTIDAGGTDASGSVTELPNNDPNEGTFVHTDSGTIAFDDVDLSDTHTASFTPQAGGYVGTFTLDPVDQVGDSVGWDFSVADSDIDFLDDGETLTQTYTVEIDDGNGGTTTQDVTVTITGAADGPQTEWYIDNSAVGSANLGTEADPFTSIAAFNAAQGGVDGPQTGATVYLLAGTGTYAETDGLNLLDDQIVVGVASGPLRPTIVTTGGDGINVAQNNTISGLDVGNTSGADIADSGGTVGILTISDVGSSGTGQIIDIDQGGTLNVVLNSAESLASSGGAVDLAGVGGSFVVSGATTVTGVHSGGGIDITGSSLSATFAGGGTVATGATAGVNFVGNSGSLALGGGFDIVTSSGAGLNASGGGTVTATGAGNSVTSTTGVAISVVGTAIGAADLTFESVSADGAAYGVRLNGTGTAGGLHVTGVGTVDGSGGTIQNIANRGLELIDTVDVVINNLALTNANTVNGTSTDLDVSNANAAIYLNDVVGASFGNVDIGGAADHGVAGTNVADFTMDGSTITLAGNGLNESGMEFVNLSGDSSVSNTEISFSETNGLDIVNTDVDLNLVLDNVVFRDSQTTNSGGPANPNGEGGLQFRSFSTAAGAPVTNIDVIDSDFLRIRTQAIQVFGNDDSVINIDITNNLMDSEAGIGSGIDLNATGSAQVTFNAIGNTILSRSGPAINLTALSGGDIEGRANDNAITANTSGAGLRVVVDGTGSTGIIEARDNAITMGTGNTASAVDVLARVGNARLDLTLDNNTLDSNTSALADINITAGASASGETASVYANIIDNDVLAGGPTNVLRLRTADLDGTSDPRIFLDGFIEAGPGLDDDAVATWNANGNTPVVTATNVNVTQTGGATSPSAGTALVPDNPMPLMADGSADDGVALTQAGLEAIVGAAVQRWADAGASAEQLAAMADVPFAVADLGGLDLGLHTADGVLIDADGAGFGWFIDASPLDDGEFSGIGGSAPVGMDLLTVVLHELGHVAGLDDHYAAPGDLMFGYLGEGERRLPDGVFGDGQGDGVNPAAQLPLDPLDAPVF